MTRTRSTLILLVTATLFATGCGTDSNDSNSGSAKSSKKSTKTGKSESPPASKEMLLENFSASLAAEQQFAEFEKALNSKNEDQLKAALQDIAGADQSFIEIGDGEKDAEIPCGEGSELIAVVVADDWQGNGDSVMGVASSTSFAGYAEKGGEDYGWVVADCKDRKVTEQILAPPEMLKKNKEEQI